MSETKTLLNALLCDIYGKQQQQARRLRRCRRKRKQDKVTRSSHKGPLAIMASSMTGNPGALEKLDIRQLIDVCAMLKVEILMMGYLLERVLISKDRLRRHQEVLCEFVTAILIVESLCILHGYYDAQPKMRFSLSPPPSKVSLTSPTSTTTSNNNNSTTYCKALSRSRNNNNMLSSSKASNVNGTDDAASDYNQWLHAMKLVARLPGGTPPEFRRKLWLSLADKYLKSKNVDWAEQREKCFCEEWREDDEELGIQIVKDLHRTGSNLCTGPAGSINQAKLKRILLGYARYNPEVGYCQGFNMLGALILQVMDKEEEESMKVMIYLVEGVLPTGYFYGSMGGLQADMGVFRELMQTKLPRLAKHLQRLQGPVENAYEPPLTNVFTMQWFLTMFCTCLPMSCVLRVWDLVLIEGSDVLLRTALVLWSLLEERVLNARTADDFYGKMGSFSNELLNGHLIDSNGLIEKVVQLGPIADIKQLRDKHLYNIAPLGNKQGLHLYYDDEDTHSDEESRLAVATVFGLNWGRRGSMGVGPPAAGKPQAEQKDRLALDISLLKKQYDRLRERQKQAHVILTTACSTATSTRQAPSSNVPVNQLLQGRPAIVTNKGKRVSAPLGAIPPARKPSLPAVLHSKPVAERQLRRGETLLWRDTDATRNRRDSLTWKEIRADRAALLREGSEMKEHKTQKLRSRLGKSDSSSYSEESDGDQEVGGKDGSSSDTSLCDDDDPKSMEQSPKRKAKLARKLKEKPKLAAKQDSTLERRRPKSWAPSNHEIPFMLMGADSGDEKDSGLKAEEEEEGELSATESGRFGYSRELHWSQAAGDLASTKTDPLHIDTTVLSITSVAQLSPLPDIASYLSTTTISPLPTPRPVYVMSEIDPNKQLIGSDTVQIFEGKEECSPKRYDISDNGVTNQYFERVNSVERPKRLELPYSISVDDSGVTSAKEEPRAIVEGQSVGNAPKAMPFELPDKLASDLTGETPPIRDDNIPGENKDDYKELLSMTIEPQITALPLSMSSAARKRRDPRRRTLTRSSTIELEERFQALEHRLSQEKCDKTESKEYIPTTASLEERFNTLEKQRSAEKQRLEENAEPISDCFAKPERIPSTAALELRFDALTKQCSSSESNAKAPLDLGDREQPSRSSPKEEKEAERASELKDTERSQTESKQTASKTEQSDKKEAENQEEKEKPRLKKLPSTAELEDRFNALERKMSVQKSSPAKAKKEPPDGEAEKENHRPTRNESQTPETVEDKSEKLTSNAADEVKVETSTNKEQSLLEKMQEKKENDAKPVEEKSKVTPKTEKAQPPKSNSSSNAEEKSEVEEVKRKPPPSTEELEKRFNALEKQLSTTNLESKDEAPKGSSSKAKQSKPETKTETSKDETEAERTTDKEEKSLKSIKSFDDKVKAMSATLTVESKTSKECESLTETTGKRQDIEDKCKSATNSPDAKEHPENGTKITAKTKPEKEATAEQPELSHRRASEPPSTDDLEKRYERLKRRMSSKNNIANETVNEALERIEQEVIAEMGDTGVVEELKVTKKEPPTTEDLESRFEALHGKDSKDAKVSAKPKIKSPPHKKDVAIEAYIPEPPPPPPVEHRIFIDPKQHQQRALIEELQSKMQGQSPGEENLKPSDINPQRKRQQQQRQLQQRPTPMGDETSEAPASTAYYRSGNYEPRQEQRTVRRFSDLPSRADLENRLQFLEKKLYKRFYKQRCASDSEVASRSVSYDDRPSTSQQAEVLLEQRVQALEKQLSENSLKLLDAIRQKDKEKERTLVVRDDSCTPRRLSTDTETGKELVRYTQNFSELEESSDKPINISINIKMLLNKDSEPKKPSTEPTTDDLRRRLEQLEQQLVEERTRNGTIIADCELSTDDELPLPPKQTEENDACKKQDKETHNQSVKCDESEKLEEISALTANSHEPETVKETKTLQNQEKAQSRSKETEIDKAINEEQAVVVETVKHKVTSEEVDHTPASKEEKKVEKVDGSTTKEKTEVKKVDPSTVSKQEITVEKTSESASKQTNNSKMTTSDVEHKIENVEKPEIVKDNPTAEINNESEANNQVINACDIGSADSNNKTVVLLMDNEPKALKVRRLTRANTEELEGLFQALEKQLNDRNLVKSKDGKLVHAETKPSTEDIEQAQAISDLSKEIENFTSGKTEVEPDAEQTVEKPVEDDPNYDWGPNPVKHHLKRKTVYLPSTKELEARFRSLERQIKLLEDVEKIDVEYRLCEIERKIKLQYSLSHEKDLNKFLELCEGKGLDDDVPVPEETSPEPERSRSPARKQASKSPYTSPSRKTPTKSPYVSPSRKSKSPYTSPTRQKTPHTSPSRTDVNKKSPYTSPARRQRHKDDLPISDDLEYKYRVLDLVRSKSKDNLSKRKNDPNKKQPIHPLEMLLDSSPDDSEIPTTGQLEHRIRVLDEKLKSPSRHKSRSRSPTIDDIKRKKMLDDQRPKTPVHSLERLVYSPTKPEPPTAEELDQRILALEKDHCFDYKTQKDYKEFNQKLKNVVSPSVSFEEFKAAKSREQSPRRPAATTPKSAMRRDDNDEYRDYRREDTTTTSYRPTSPKVIRFRDEDEDYFEEKWRPKSRQGHASERMNLADRSYSSSTPAAAGSVSEGLDELGCRLMRETSPITRTGTHTGVPLRTADNINERLSSIKNSIKSIDSLCEEKSYQKEKCQRYIDSLFSDSTHFASKKSSAEDLAHSRSESRGRGTQRATDYTPSIRISSEHRSLGSAESLRTGSPLRGGISPPHHRSHRDISRELSPSRRRREAEELEERESSRVRRDNMLPNYFVDNRNELSSCSSLTKFHKVDRQLEETCAKYADDRRSACKSPLSSPYETRTTGTRYNSNNTCTPTAGDNFNRPISPYRQPYDPNRSTRSNTPVYQPAKLEIRHTTVTSTFYDRFLTERQIEKQTLSRPPSRSPVVSPSVTTKSYTDLPGSLSAHKYSRESTVDVAVTTSSYSSPMSRSYAGSSSNYSYLTTQTAASEAPASSSSFAPQLSASPSGSVSDLRSRYETKPTTSISSITSSTSTSIPSYSSSNITASAFTPYNFTSSFSSRLNDPIATTTTSSVVSNLSSSPNSYSTGVYNPMMSFTLREPSIGSTSSGLLGQYQYKSGLSTNYSYSPTKSEADKP